MGIGIQYREHAGASGTHGRPDGELPSVVKRSAVGWLLVSLLVAGGCDRAANRVTGPSSSGSSGSGSPGTSSSSLGFSQTTVSFPSTTVGTTSAATATITVTSAGSAPLQFTNLTSSNSTVFPYSTTCRIPGSLAVGSTCSISVQFRPSASGSASGQIVLTANGATGTILLSGTGTGSSGTGTGNSAACQMTPAGGSFVLNASQTPIVVANNTGQSSVTISRVSLSGPFSTFSGSGGAFPTCPAAPFTLSAGQICNWYVRFAPTSPGTANGSMNISTSCPAQSTISYTFTGLN